MCNEKFQMYKLGFKEAEEPEIKVPTSVGMENAREFRKNIYFCFIDYTKTFDFVDHNKLWKILKEMGVPETTLHVSRETYVKVKKPQLEPDMEQHTGSKLGKEYNKAIYCHPTYLTYMHSTSCEMLGLMNHRLESKLQGKILTTSYMH